MVSWGWSAVSPRVRVGAPRRGSRPAPCPAVGGELLLPAAGVQRAGLGAAGACGLVRLEAGAAVGLWEPPGQ